tara:strand:+ start:203 stop:592 length:390 start_codon:yes stop_codon:yes gene_type:complete
MNGTGDNGSPSESEMFTTEETEHESGPQRAGLYLDSLLFAAAQEAQWRRDQWLDEDWSLAAEVLMVLAGCTDCVAVYEKVEALSAEALATLVGQCQGCVWRVHYRRAECRLKGPSDGRRLLEKLFLGTR